MKQKELAFATPNQPEWDQLPPSTRKKLLRLMAQLLEQAWRGRKEDADEREDH